jgi:hypothetical protein
MHMRGKSAQYRIVYAMEGDPAKRAALYVALAAWYDLAEPLKLPKGTKLSASTSTIRIIQNRTRRRP